MDTQKKNLELINVAIQKLLEERKNREELGDNFIEDDDDDQLLLSRLLSQLESLKSDTAVQQPEVAKEPQPSGENDIDKSVPSDIENVDQSDVDVDVDVDVDTEDIIKELGKVKRQNSITHWLLSVMIVLTVAWQISEVSLLWKVKNGLSNPFRCLGGMLTGMLRGPAMTGQEEEEEKSNQQLEALSLPSFKMPELSRSEDKH